MIRRPDLIILNDIDPDESNYSQYQMRKRLTTIIDTVLAMNERAHVALIGTVTMPGSIVHQLVETVTTTKDVPQWITDEKRSAEHTSELQSLLRSSYAVFVLQKKKKT